MCVKTPSQVRLRGKFNRGHNSLVWPVRQAVVVEEARSQLVAGTIEEPAQAQEDVVEVTGLTI